MATQSGKRAWPLLVAAAAAACVGSGLAPRASAASGLWQSPIDLTPEGAWSDSQAVAMNQAGDAVVVWRRERQEDPPTPAYVQAAIRRAGQSFLPVENLSAGGHDPKVAVAADGTVFTVFDLQGTLRAVVRSPDGRVGPRETVSEVRITDNKDIHVDDHGTATAFFVGQDDVVRASARPRGGSWGAADTIPWDGGRVEEADFAVGGNGDAIAAWGSYYGVVHAALRRGGESFSRARVLNTPHESLTAPQVAMNRRGDAVVAWSERRPKGNFYTGFIKAAVRPAGGELGATETIAEVDIHANPPRVAISDSGQVTVALSGTVEAPLHFDGITAFTRPPRGRFDAGQVVVGDDEEGSDLQVDDDAAGNTYATWRKYTYLDSIGNAHRGRAYAAVRPVGGRFPGRAHVLSRTDLNVWSPEIATGGPGQAIVAWPIGRFPSTFWIQSASSGGGAGGAGGGGPGGDTGGGGAGGGGQSVATPRDTRPIEASAVALARRFSAALRRRRFGGLLGRRLVVRWAAAAAGAASVKIRSADGKALVGAAQASSINAPGTSNFTCGSPGAVAGCFGGRARSISSWRPA